MSAVEYVSNNDTIKEIIKLVNELHKKTESLWSSSKYFRIISTATVTITISWCIRNIYLKYYRKYYNLPPGPYGIPLIGQIPDVLNPASLCELGKNKCVISICLGPAINMIAINNPYLVKKLYASQHMVDRYNPAAFSNADDTMFINVNGPQWAKRRKIVFANLMSTMKGSFVENATKSFIKNKVFNIFDDKIQNNEQIMLKSLLPPLGFNLILQACFGQELKTLDDPFYIKFDQLLREKGRNQVLEIIVQLLCGTGKFSKYVLHLFGITNSFEEMIELIDDFVLNEKNNIKRDKTDKLDADIKLFNDYIKDYTEHKDNKLNKRHLYGDMTMMFFAATDTTYSALAFAILYAAKYPVIQEELYKELRDAFDNDINNITLDMNKGGLLKIPKLRAFIHEILRIHPPVFGAGFREINVDRFQIDTQGYDGSDNKIYDVPKGKCALFINLMSIHHNPKWWIKDYDEKKGNMDSINMNEVHLDFWLDSNGNFNKSANAVSLLTFSRGKRDCVGRSLAMKELYLVLAMIFMRYKVYGPNGDEKFEIKRVLDGVMEPDPQIVTLELR